MILSDLAMDLGWPVAAARGRRSRICEQTRSAVAESHKLLPSSQVGHGRMGARARTNPAHAHTGLEVARAQYTYTYHRAVFCSRTCMPHQRTHAQPSNKPFGPLPFRLPSLSTSRHALSLWPPVPCAMLCARALLPTYGAWPRVPCGARVRSTCPLQALQLSRALFRNSLQR